MTSNNSYTFRRDGFIVFLIVLGIVAVFGQVRDFDFVNMDDDIYIEDNVDVQRGITGNNVVWAMLPHIGHWHPLTWLSYMLDIELFGLNSGGHHLINVLFHLLNSVLLFVAFRVMTGAPWRSALVALLFALHPLHVEPVVWISSRKDMLSTFFFIVTLLAYTRYVKQPGYLRMALVIAMFALGLMAKPMLVTVPFTLLLLDYWPLGRFSDVSNVCQFFKRALSVIAEKIPLFIMTALSCVLTFIAGLKVNVLSSLDSYSMPIRITNAMTSYGKYALKTLWPNNLSIYYVHPGAMPPFGELVAALLFLGGCTGLVLFLGRRHRHLPVGWFWFLGTLVPVIGIIQIGTHLTADRYTYVPLIGLFLILSWSLPAFEGRPRSRRVTVCIITVLVLSLTLFSWIQTRHWQNSRTIFAHAITTTDDNFYAHTNLGFALYAEGDYEAAVEQFRAALRLNPVFYKARVNLGITLSRLGRYTEAEPHLADAIKREPEDPLGYFNLGLALAWQGRYREALVPLETAARLFPDDPEIYYVLAVAHSGLNDFPAARGQLANTLHLAPGHAEALELLKKLPRGNTP